MRKNFVQDAELVYGVHPVLEILKSKKRRVFKIYTTRPEPQSFKLLKSLLVARAVPIVYKDRAELTRLVGVSDHQSIVAVVGPFVFRAQPFDSVKQHCIILLDGVQDARNVGAIIRSAYCTGFEGVIIPRKSTAPINAATIKSSAGLIEHIQVRQPASTAAALIELKQAGYNVYITALTATAQDAAQVEFKTPLCVVIGSEGTGVSKDVLACGTVIRLAQRQADISYNASVAAGIVMFLIAHQQKII